MFGKGKNKVTLFWFNFFFFFMIVIYFTVEENLTAFFMEYSMGWIALQRYEVNAVCSGHKYY